MKYTVDFYIKMFRKIPGHLWTTGVFENGVGQRCALGHCTTTDIQAELCTLFRGAGLNVADVNDNYADDFKQESPRGRILAALRYIKNTCSR